MVWITILVSLALVLFGRRLFWIFVGGVGFITGVTLAARMLQAQPEWVMLVIGILAGVMGAMLVVFLQRLAIFMGGFLAGAYILINLLSLFNIQTGNHVWLVMLIGGICGAILISSVFDWAVILLSSLAGSLMIIQSLDLQSAAAAMVFVGLMLVGIVFQSRSGKDQRLRGKR